MYYVAVDIGCIECGESTAVLGISADKDKAQTILDDAAAIQQENWIGQHSFELFEVEEIT